MTMPAVKAWSDAENMQTRAYLDSLPSRRRHREAAESMVRENVTKLFLHHGAAGDVVRDEISAAETAANARHAQFRERFEIGKSAWSIRTRSTAKARPRSIGSSLRWMGRRWPSLSPKAGARMERCIFTMARAARNSATRSRTCNIRPPAGARPGMRTGRGVYYTHFPRKGERPEEDLNFYQQVYFHKLGTPDSADTYSIGKDFPADRRDQARVIRDGKYVLASVANGDGGDFAHYLLGPDGAWKQITQV